MREAVSAIFICQREVFIIRRQSYLKAFPGYYAFPGGKVDTADHQAFFSQPLLADLPAQQAGTLVREIREELGFDLEQAVEQGLVGAIDYFGEAITPHFGELRFNAHFYRIELHHKPRFVTDPSEIAWSRWLDHRELYRHYQDGEALMVVPIMNAIRTLAENIHASGAGPFNLEYDAARELPYLEPLRGVGLIPVPSNTLPPAKATNALLLGDEPRILVDPSPATPEIYARLLRTLKGRLPQAIMISHHHPDHHEMAPELARELGIPLCCSARTLEELREIYGAGLSAGIEVRVLEEGEVLTQWMGQPVHCHALPGHDAGMLGLMPDSRAWIFVADLVQAGASVVIPDHGGDMSAYFACLQRVIDLQPRVLILSHGFPAGGTHLVEQSLRHRQMREAQVRQGQTEGLNIEQLSARLYPDIDPQLRPFAEQNIRQHLKRLDQERDD